MYSFLITGPESTGKSTLSDSLAKHFGGKVVKEYARGYVEKLPLPYIFEDVEIIAKQQIADYNITKHKAGKHQPVFFDTFLIITKVWFEEVFNCCPIWFNEAINIYTADFALLCAPDLPWEADGVRENPHKRQYLFDCYESELKYYNIPYGIVRGVGEERIGNAAKLVESQLKYDLHSS